MRTEMWIDLQFYSISGLASSIFSSTKEKYNLVKTFQFVKDIFGVVVKDIAIGAGGIGFDYRAGEVGFSVTNDSTPLLCFIGAVLPKR